MTTDAVGGIWTYSLDLAGAFVTRGISVRLLALGPSASDRARADARRRGLDLLETGLALEWLASGPDEVGSARRAIALEARRFAADVVHLHAPALAAQGLFPCPVLAINHGCVATWWTVMRKGAMPDTFVWCTTMTREGLSAADAVATPSASFASLTARTYRLETVPIVAHNGRNGALAAGDRLCDEAFVAARLWDEGKGIDALDRAAALQPFPVYAAGALAGPNGATIALRSLVALGVLDPQAIRRRLASRPVYIGPSRYEPFGLAVLEAAQAGCALLLSDCDSFHELWDGAAMFVDIDDAPAFAAAIRELVADHPRRARLGAAARARASSFSLDAMADRTLAIYDGLLAMPPALRA